MSGQRISISYEGAEALRDFAKAMPYAVEQMAQASADLRVTFTSIADDLGDLGKDLSELINNCILAVETAQESIEGLPAGLEKTADDIEKYLNDHIADDSSSSGAGPHRGARTFDTKVHTHR